MVDVGIAPNTVEFSGTLTSSGMVYHIIVNGLDITNMVTDIRIEAGSDNSLPRVALLLSPHVLKTSALPAELTVTKGEE